MRRVVVAAEGRARRDERHRRLARRHRAHLDVARVGAKERRRGRRRRAGRGPLGADIDPEGVLHVGGGVVGGVTQPAEVVLLELDLWPVVHGKAEAREHVDDLVADERDGVPVPAGARQARREGEIEGRGVELRVAPRAHDRREPLLEGALHLLPHRVHELSHRLSLGRGNGAHPFQEDGELALLPEDLRVLVAKLLLGRGSLEASAKGRAQRLERPRDGLDRCRARVVGVGSTHDVRQVR